MTTSFLVPRYVPPGFELFAHFSDPVDGLGGGKDELALFFRNKSHPLAMTHPIAIYMTQRPTRPLALTEEQPSETLALHHISGELAANYHDGYWIGHPAGERTLANGGRMTWRRGNVHSLTFKISDISVGIRASFASGITRRELERIAEALG